VRVESQKRPTSTPVVELLLHGNLYYSFGEDSLSEKVRE